MFADPAETWVLAQGSALAAGAYTLSVLGTNSTGRGSYDGMLSVISAGVQTVPEPATGALMLAALAAAVVQRRRRAR